MWIKGIDGIDNKILKLLLEDGRMSFSELAKRVELTRTAVKNRIKALEEKGIIAGYRAVIKPNNAPETLTFVVNIETTADKFEQVKDYFAKTSETLTIVQTTGNCHLLAICIAPDVRAMREFINSAYRKVEGITCINSQAVLDIVKGEIIPQK
jgi:DNA-binding Lrp family transcriptional regulator